MLQPTPMDDSCELIPLGRGSFVGILTDKLTDIECIGKDLITMTFSLIFQMDSLGSATYQGK